MERELARRGPSSRSRRRATRRCPRRSPIASADEYDAAFDAAVTEYMAFLRDRGHSDRARATWTRAPGAGRHVQPRAARVLHEVDYRDPEVMRTHGYHWFDKALDGPASPHPSPIRREAAPLQPLQHPHRRAQATGWEEMMLQAGMFDARPALARTRLHPARPAGGAGARRPAHAQQRVHARAGRRVHVPPTRLAAGSA